MRKLLAICFGLLCPVHIIAQVPQLGARVRLGFLAEETPLPLVTSISPDGPADRAGLAVGDTIVAVAGRAASLSVLQEEAATLKPGDRLPFVVHRGARSLPITLIVMELIPTQAPTMLIRDSIDARAARYLVAACREVKGPPKTAEDSAAVRCATNPTRLSMGNMLPTRMPLRKWVDQWGARFEMQSDPAADTNAPVLVVVTKVDKGGIGEHAGLKVGDIVTRVAGQKSSLEAVAAVHDERIVILDVLRKGRSLTVRVHPAR